MSYKVEQNGRLKNIDNSKKVNKPRFEDNCKKAIDYAKARRTISEAKCRS